MFVIQTSNGVICTEIGVEVYNSILLDNWMYPEYETKYRLQEDNTPIGEDDIPIGDVAWTEAVSGITLKPVNIPDICNREPYILRGGCKTLTRGELSEALCRTPLFVKSATRTKSYSPVITSNIEEVPMDTLYFCSPVTEFITEWRIFVFHGEIVDVRRYIGSWENELSAQEVQMVKKQINSIYLPYPAYTVDIGRNPDGNFEWIEVHPFISCGLYGFQDSRIIKKMAVSAYKYQKNTGRN